MEETQKNLGGRPTKFTPNLVLLVETYLETWKENDDVVIPTLEGLALSLNVAKKTLLAWEKECPVESEKNGELYERFCNAIEKVREKQSNLLINGGVKGTFNSTITKLLLTNHGYKERTDTTSDDKPLPAPTGLLVTSEAVQEGVRAFEEALRPKR